MLYILVSVQHITLFQNKSIQLEIVCINKNHFEHWYLCCNRAKTENLKFHQHEHNYVKIFLL